MKLPRDVSGERLAGTLCRRWQYRRVHKSGSHIDRFTSGSIVAWGFGVFGSVSGDGVEGVGVKGDRRIGSIWCILVL